MSGSRSLAALGMTWLLSACALQAPKTQVLTPPPSAPIETFSLATVDIQSREVGPQAWSANEQYASYLVSVMRQALRERGKAEVDPPAPTVRMRVYVASGAAPVRAAGSKTAGAFIEVRLQLLEAGTGAVRYSTHTRAPLPVNAVEEMLAEDRDLVIRETLRTAAQDFVSRL